MKPNVFWGVRPQSDGSYCNINMDTGMMNYLPPRSDNDYLAIVRKPSSIKLSLLAKQLFLKPDPMVMKTLSMFEKAHWELYNSFINEKLCSSLKRQSNKE